MDRGGQWPATTGMVVASGTMTLLIQPPVSTRQLAGPDEVGRFVLVNGRLAIVCVSPQDVQKILMLATYDGKSFWSTQYASETVLAFGDEFVIEPDVATGLSAVPPGPQSGGALLADEHAHYIVLQLGSDWRLVKLESGEILAHTN